MNIDLDRYNEIGKYGIGELFIGSVGKKGVVVEKGDEAIFDTDSLNYHFYPKKRNENIEKEILDKIKEILEAAKADPDIKITNSQKEMEEAISDGQIIIYCNEKGGCLRKNNEIICRLFRYIAAKKNDILYELNFMRFYISQDNSVNCILKSIQFDRVIDSGRSIMKRRVNRNGICYPNSYRGQSIKQLEETILAKNNGKSFFYNPQIGFGDEAEAILGAFKKFIEICDKKMSENDHA